LIGKNSKKNLRFFKRKPFAIAVGRAILKNYRLNFDKRSGVAN